MRLLAFAVKDDKANGFAHPFFASAKGQAVRMFGDWCKDVNTPLGKHPEDYRLFYIGGFDDESGLFDCVTGGLELVSSGADWIEAPHIREVRNVN